MTVMSTPASSRRIAALWRKMCGVTFFVASVRQARCAARA